MDPDKSLQTYQKKRLSKSIARLEKASPQITVSFCSLYLPDGVDGRQFGYWLLNRCKPESGLDAKNRLHHLLILVDRNHKTVSTSVGYGLDCFLDDMTLHQTLQRCREPFIHKGFVEGSIHWIDHIRKELPSIHEKAQADWKHRYKKRHLRGKRLDTADPKKAQQIGRISTPRPRSLASNSSKQQLDNKVHA